MPENDKLSLTLDTLRSDIERNPLADSQAVRRRGDQRTRRQAVGGALAVVALVAGAAGLYGGVGGGTRADGQIPTTQNPTASTEVEQPLPLAAQPLLTPADLGTVGTYKAWQVNPEPNAADQLNLQCLPLVRSVGGGQTESRLLYDDLDGRVFEHVIRFTSAIAAADAVDPFTGAFASCESRDPTVVDRKAIGVAVAGGDSAVHFSRASAPAQSDLSYFEMGIVRKGSVLVVLQWTSMGQPEGVDWVWDADRMRTALDRAVG